MRILPEYRTSTTCLWSSEVVSPWQRSVWKIWSGVEDDVGNPVSLAVRRTSPARIATAVVLKAFLLSMRTSVVWQRYGCPVSSERRTENEATDVIGSVVQAGDVHGDIRITVSQAPKPAVSVPRELPSDVVGFSGRDAEVAQLDDLLEKAQDTGPVVISAVSGMPGIGKTALAVHWAHRVRHRFPDGDLYLDLQGYDPGQPIAAEDALASLLRSVVGSDEPLPPGLSERAARFRTVLANRRMLMLLDNARSPEQVRFLLPGTGSSFVLVTSRDSLAGLVSRHGARRVDLDLLTAEEAVALFGALVGERAAAEPEGARILCEWSGLLPLAVRVTAEMVNSYKTATLAALAAELFEVQQDRLERLDAGGDDRTAVSAVFSWSYRQLPEDAARAFRFIGAAPGHDLDVFAVAALVGTDKARARRAVGVLLQARLVERIDDFHIHMHDLLRSYATGLHNAQDTERERGKALGRLFKYYVVAACRAVEAGDPRRRGKWAVEITDAVQTPSFTDAEQAWKWLNDQHRNLAAVLEAVVGSGLAPVKEVSAAEQVLGLLAHQDSDLSSALARFDRATATALHVRADRLDTVWLDQVGTMLAAGMADAALDYLDEVRLQLRKAGRHPDVVHAIASVEHARARCRLLLEDYAQARQLARSAARRFSDLGDHLWCAVAKLTALRATVTTSGSSGSRTGLLLTEALSLSRELRDFGLLDEAELATVLAVRLELRHGRLVSAAARMSQLPPPRVNTPVDHRLLRRLARAEIAMAEGNPEAALREADIGLTELDEARDRFGGLDQVRSAAVHARGLGAMAVRIAIDHGHDAADVMLWSERTRAQLYRHTFLPVDHPELDRVINELRHVSRTLLRERLDGLSTRSTQARQRALEREALRLGARTRSLGAAAPPAGFTDVIGALRSDQALIDFIVIADELHVVVVTRGTALMLMLGSMAAVAEGVRRVHADMNALAPDHLPPPLAEVISASARREADKLDRILMEPLLDVVDGANLVLVPTGALFALPWGCLPSLRGRPTTVAPSVNAWLAATRRARRPSKERVALVSGPGLPWAESESRRLASLYPGAHVLSGQDARIDAVLHALENSETAHFATHGDHEPTNALLSRLELADGPLFAHHITRLQNSPRHVVLAAGDLALHHVGPGDEILGFAGALLTAGTSTVTAAVTRVGDVAAQKTMLAYHQALAAGATAAHALAMATAPDPLRRPFVQFGTDFS
ncbi:CHAT domain-containing protein [Saccharothrix carnea]|uniref:CHAT domain-containing protein n=1 Tax=Saccharothrix carnea TaxID=1280637 RepID=UPI0015E778F6|nr:CHAT domain-containing protein [Saccharothrix carnea]